MDETSFQGMQSLNKLSYSRVHEMDDFFRSIKDRRRPSPSAEADIGSQEYTYAESIRRRHDKYEGIFRSSYYSMELRVTDKWSKVERQQSAFHSWKSLAYYKAFFWRCCDVVERSMRSESDARRYQWLPELILDSPWAGHPLLLEEICNLLVDVDLEAHAKDAQAIDEQVEAAIRTIEAALDGMPKMMRLVAAVSIDAVHGLEKLVWFEKKLHRRLMGRGLKTEVYMRS